MKPEPVAQTVPPAYPTRAEVTSDPGWLDRHCPRAWPLAGGLAGAVAAILAAGTSGCGGRPAGTRPAAPVHEPDPLVVEASDWVRSVFGKPVPVRARLGGEKMPAPWLEDDVKPALRDMMDENRPPDAK